MPDYILDTCVDINPKYANYPKYFFEDLWKNMNINLVTGGTVNLSEIKKKEKLRELINEFKTRNQVIEIDNTRVDDAENRLKSRVEQKCESCPEECDDLHIFALAKISGCLNVITRDNRIALCRKKIRDEVGHDYCPNIRVIQNEGAYKDTKA
ncbi:hypothetical protein [Pacificibacter sp. AS14]|uniref:hypothetical protein n=1 Tax=Pacificibacter sp. AS14 TaxID=3135785 RepID=UPI0031743911